VNVSILCNPIASPHMAAIDTYATHLEIDCLVQMDSSPFYRTSLVSIALCSQHEEGRHGSLHVFHVSSPVSCSPILMLSLRFGIGDDFARKIYFGIDLHHQAKFGVGIDDGPPSLKSRLTKKSRRTKKYVLTKKKVLMSKSVVLGLV
jgi:hypothetical protein